MKKSFRQNINKCLLRQIKFSRDKSKQSINSVFFFVCNENLLQFSAYIQENYIKILKHISITNMIRTRESVRFLTKQNQLWFSVAATPSTPLLPSPLSPFPSLYLRPLSIYFNMKTD